jgi:hypothetical protein
MVRCEVFLVQTVFTDVTPQMAVWREEIFGPVLAVMTFRTEAEALSRPASLKVASRPFPAPYPARVAADNDEVEETGKTWEVVFGKVALREQPDVTSQRLGVKLKCAPSHHSRLPPPRSQPDCHWLPPNHPSVRPAAVVHLPGVT